ncbi:MAG: stage III sporulation AC/AD family protein [Oscillospiraceae bacterium]|nr:stage III sporulation AC/AD family protein [Oscillospiraceae bacterium]
MKIKRTVKAMEATVFTLIGLGIVAAVMAVVLRQHRPEFALLLSLGAGALILGGIVAGMRPVLGQIQSVFDHTGLPAPYAEILFKALGLCFITQIACDACKDAGETAIGSKVELAGKIGVLVISLPLFSQVLGIVDSLLR